MEVRAQGRLAVLIEHSYREMTVTVTLSDAGAGTNVLGVHDNLPPGVAPIDNEKGWRMALEKLGRLVEEPPP